MGHVDHVVHEVAQSAGLAGGCRSVEQQTNGQQQQQQQQQGAYRKRLVVEDAVERKRSRRQATAAFGTLDILLAVTVRQVARGTLDVVGALVEEDRHIGGRGNERRVRGRCVAGGRGVKDGWR